MAEPGSKGLGIPLPVALILGLLLSVMGVFLFAVLQGKFGGIQQDRLHVPIWVLWAAALVFLCFGLGLLCAPFFQRLSGWFMLAAVLSFVAIFNWIAFGPGERNFTSRSSIGTTSISHASSKPASETEGRLVFGIFAGGMDAVILYGVVAAIRKRFKNHDSVI